jgi:hypothetical protein
MKEADMPVPVDHDLTERAVRVIDRSGWGTSAAYPQIRTVTLTWVCPVCHGPRGIPKEHRFHEDGHWLTCDRWDNPCGHLDLYTAVLAEARERHPAGLRPRP